MKFSEWGYTRPDYSEVKKKINSCKNKMQSALSYQMLRNTNCSRRWSNVDE
ncbi:MAG: hypothetical protein K2I22_02655 [Lachnospiraceae bacterium]|nr:hypothetical protein [Lachnospiraceae bacterium]